MVYISLVVSLLSYSISLTFRILGCFVAGSNLDDTAVTPWAEFYIPVDRSILDLPFDGSNWPVDRNDILNLQSVYQPGSGSDISFM